MNAKVFGVNDMFTAFFSLICVSANTSEHLNSSAAITLRLCPSLLGQCLKAHAYWHKVPEAVSCIFQ